MAAALVAWSLLAIRQQRLIPRWPVIGAGPRWAWALPGAAAALVAYWLLRLTLQLGWGWRTFPAA